MFPIGFTERMKELLGEKEYEEFLSAFDEDKERIHALRINSLKVSEGEKAAVLKTVLRTGEAAEPDEFSRVPWEENGFYYDESSFPGKHPYHEAGLYYIQEPSAMAPVHFLDPRPGERVLDLCAAPGGKSTQIASRMAGEGLLVTNEINRERSKILSLNIERMGISNALVLNEDSAHLSQVFEGYFDKILVDAPCSGEGMFRKNDNATGEWSPENVKLCAARQKEILDNAAKMLLPGGRLVYSTCTFAPEENEQNVAGFLARHPDFEVEEAKLLGGMESGKSQWVYQDELIAAHDEANLGAAPDMDKILSEVGRSVRLWPHKVHGEGHFLCVFRRQGETMVEGQKSYVPGGKNTTAKKELLKLFWEFWAETASDSVSDPEEFISSLVNVKNQEPVIISFGDQLYLAPAYMPGIKGLKLQRPGLHLGTVKKDRFEPSHALVLALGRDMVKLTVDLASDSPKIRQFLNGQSIRLPSDEYPELAGQKGWCLVTCDGYSIGWSKLAGGMLKNHYPKGLRINY